MTTIFAVSSGLPPCAIAIMRLSGPGAFGAVSQLIGGALPTPREATLRALRDPWDGSLLDRALVILFPGPNSATGEDVAELHLHGGRAVVAAVDAALGAMPGLVRAEAGEFTRRALLSGRIDLTEAEGLADLLAAETEMQRRSALAAAEGALRRKAEGWTDQIVAAAALVEASLDFSDEADVSPAGDLRPAFAPMLETVAEEMHSLLAAPTAERLRDGLRIVIAGPPNSGKSTLLNALCGREAAIVTDIAGTTRDVIEVALARDGVPYLLSDTAGLRDDTADAVEAIGIARAQVAMDGADIVLWLGDDEPPADARALWLYPRADEAERGQPPSARCLEISAVTGFGLAELWTSIERIARALLPRGGDIALNARQRGVVAQCASSLEEAVTASDTLISAEQLRLALRAMHGLTGRGDVEHVLDDVFGRFCIGK